MDGGAVATYRTERRLRPSGLWTEAGMAIESEATLSNQERASELEFRVIAINKAGDGLPSNIVLAVL